jgi:hypothetical protein
MVQTIEAFDLASFRLADPGIGDDRLDRRAGLARTRA